MDKFEEQEMIENIEIPVKIRCNHCDIVIEANDIQRVLKKLSKHYDKKHNDILTEKVINQEFDQNVYGTFTEKQYDINVSCAYCDVFSIKTKSVYYGVFPHFKDHFCDDMEDLKKDSIEEMYEEHDNEDIINNYKMDSYNHR
jgi:predicted small metal-binding protein